MDDDRRVHPTADEPFSRNPDVSEYDAGEDGEGSGELLLKESASKLDCDLTVLVVGKQKDHKAGIVDALARGVGSKWVEKTTAAGLRILNSAETSPEHILLDTTPLEYAHGKSVSAVAKRWVSENSLRRAIFGRSVVVVCVIPYSALKDPCYSSDHDHQHCWVDALRIIFRDYKGGVLFLVNGCPRDVSNYSKDRIKVFVTCHDFDQRNVVFRRHDEDVRTAIEQSIVGTSKGPKTAWGRVSDALSKHGVHVKPFLMKEVRSSRRKYEVWGPDRILLFGRTGSGKSTLAQMLTRGKLDANSEVFSFGSGIRGMTRNIERGEGRGWYVVDTPGFGEPDSEQSTATTDQVCQMIKKFIAVVEGTFTHYLFVLQKGRIDELEVNLWKFFKLLFGDDLGSHFSVVVSNADSDWLGENVEDLRKHFDGCRSFLCAEFPRLELDEDGTSTAVDLEVEAENEAIRTSSLHELEEQLDRLRRCDRPCYYGKNSRMTKVVERDRCNMDSKIDRSLVVKALVQLFEAGAELDKFVSRLAHTLTVNNKVAMLPVLL